MTDNLLTAEIPSSANDVPANVPAKFWNAEKQEINVDALLTSYLSLEKKMSQSFIAPNNDEDKIRLHRMLGCPETPDGYKVCMNSDLFDTDPELNARLHAKGFTNDQVQEVYDLAAQKIVPLILEMSAEFQAEREIERLVKEFGSVNRWQEIARQLNDYGRKNLPPLAFEGMTCSYDGVMALYNMMKSNKDISFTKDNGGEFDNLDEKSLKKLMQNPKYWRDKDPSFIAKVTSGFEKLYGA